LTGFISSQAPAGELILLGTGTSVGVPAIGCDCPVCRSPDPKNQRTRCAALCRLPQGNLLIDTPPDLRTQLLREKIGIVHSVLYTHEHADHLYGLDDLRIFAYYLGGPVPIYCSESVEGRIRRVFDYAFEPLSAVQAGGVPQLDLRRIDSQTFEALGQVITPIRLLHAPGLDVLGFRIGNVAYCTDTSGIPPESISRLEGLDVLVLDALRYRPHSTHFSLGEAMKVAERLRPRRTIFTHMSHDLEHESTSASLPAGMELGYDGMRIPLT
jgi:phosphoribosyl 1,2-cyclic phosphate phosphodiesterase